jgi:hypothetical protein
MMKMPTD